MPGYNKKSVSDVEVGGKRVLLRCDFNVPLDKKTGEITDDGRIVAALPTINYLLDNGAAVVACSHLGRPDGEFNAKYSLAPVAKRLSELLGKPVKLAKDVIGDDAKALVSGMKPGELVLLENLRFHKEEEKNDPAYAKALADYAELYVSDAFGCVHRAHASTEGVSKYLPAVSGFLIARELKYLGGAVSDPARPLVAVMGGSKVSDKIGVLINLLDKTDTLVLGGGMAYTFIKALGGKIGKSLCEEDRLDYAREVFLQAAAKGVKILLPVDSVAASELGEAAVPVTVKSADIPDNLLGLDIGPAAAAIFAKEINRAGTVIWNGPMGVFENPKFAAGTIAVSYALADSAAVSVIGGGDSAAAIREFGLDYRVTHVSTGGGASMEFLEGKTLPGIACLLDN